MCTYHYYLLTARSEMPAISPCASWTLSKVMLDMCNTAASACQTCGMAQQYASTSVSVVVPKSEQDVSAYSL